MKWRDENNLAWLETAPLLTMPNEREAQRVPYPLTWEQQRLLLIDWLCLTAWLEMSSTTSAACIRYGSFPTRARPFPE
jgi:hypothetical protein